jgi:hypothetical protein
VTFILNSFRSNVANAADPLSGKYLMHSELDSARDTPFRSFGQSSTISERIERQICLVYIPKSTGTEMLRWQSPGIASANPRKLVVVHEEVFALSIAG